MRYKDFMEWKDIFGFDSKPKVQQKEPKAKTPTQKFDVETMCQHLSEQKLGEKDPSLKFIDVVQWGEGEGSIKIRLGTGINVFIERLSHDLQGSPHWLAKKIYQINREGYGGYEVYVANELMSEVIKINEKKLDTPKNKWENIEKLIVDMASRLRSVARSIFIFEGITKLKDNHYVICFSVRGHGVEAPDHRRVIQNQTDVVFEEDAGLLKIVNTNVEAGVGSSNKWEIMPADSITRFAPTQSNEEIIETIATVLKYY
jgi:hypothetical protein